MRFAMPNGETMEIVPSQEIDTYDIGTDEIIEGVVYFIEWEGKKLPWYTKTRCDATAIAMGCQFGAFQMAEKMRGI